MNSIDPGVAKRDYFLKTATHKGKIRKSFVGHMSAHKGVGWLKERGRGETSQAERLTQQRSNKVTISCHSCHKG